jgi:hypothetical protein
VMLSAAAGAHQPAVLAVLGPGCDGELTPDEVLRRVAVAARVGAWTGTWSVTPEIADEIETAARASYTEASLQIVRCARGETGDAEIRGGRRTVPLGPLGALAFFFEIGDTLAELAPLAPLVAGTESIEAGRQALADAGVRTELDYERERAER